MKYHHDRKQKKFQISDKCHICDKLYDLKDVKVTGHCSVTAKYLVTSNRSYNVAFQMTNKIPVLSHSLIGDEGHHIMQEIGKFGQKATLIANGLGEL